MTFIDTHSHYIPEKYVEALAADGRSDAGGRALPPWTLSAAIDLMDTHEIETSILSISSPGVCLSGRGEYLARLVNEIGADIVRDHPQRFGLFASLPVTNVEASLAELSYAYDVLGADGVVLLANVDGVYLGDASLDPLMQELDRRKAVVFIHPNELPGTEPVGNIPAWAIDFPLDTTRAAVNLVATDTISKYPGIRFILSHAGGFLPYVAGRVALTGRFLPAPGKSPKEMLAELRTFYFDTALSSTPFALPSLLSFVGPDHVLFGSDWPFAPTQSVSYFTSALADWELQHPGLTQSMHTAAEELFPRLA